MSRKHEDMKILIERKGENQSFVRGENTRSGSQLCSHIGDHTVLVASIPTASHPSLIAVINCVQPEQSNNTIVSSKFAAVVETGVMETSSKVAGRHLEVMGGGGTWAEEPQLGMG
jgi:hypothetical protein